MSGGNRGWFEGTMEVISGMAPRPSTPQPYQARSMSAPNSPARHNFPGINRLPSQDSLDRSIHNESGHGKSTAQIVRDLKASNAALSAKTASMEAQFMNQLSEVTKSFEDRQRFLEDSLRKKDKLLAQQESMKVAAESKLKEKDAQLSKVKEESAFQRHTISDLKNQLYQIQTEMEEMEFEKRDDIERLAEDNQEMARVIELLQRQVEEGMQAREEVEVLRVELEKAREHSSPSSDADQKDRDDVENPNATNPQEEDTHLVWKKLEKTQGELEKHRQRLTVSEGNLEILRKEKLDQAEEHNKRVEELEGELKKSSEDWKKREIVLCEQIESLEVTDNKMTRDFQVQLEERDDEIAELQDQVQKYADQTMDLSAELAQVRQDAANQEVYRRDEAEDLRILHDAQEEEIEKLRKDLDESQRELELRDQELDEREREVKEKEKEASDEIEQLREELDKKDVMENEVTALKRELDEKDKLLEEKEQTIRSFENTDKSTAISEDPGLIGVLEEDLYEAREGAKQLEQKILDLKEDHKEEIAALQSVLTTRTDQKSHIESRLAALQEEHDDTLAKLEKHSTDSDEISRLEKQIEVLKDSLGDMVNAEQAALNKAREYQDVAREVEELKSVKATDAQEIERLRVDLANAEKRAAENNAKALVKKNEEISNLNKKVKAMESSSTGAIEVRKQLREKNEEISKLNQKVKAMEASGTGALEVKKQLREKNEEISKLNQQVKAMEASGTGALEVKKQLREAQIALVALDDEKKQMASSHRELLTAVENKKDELQRKYRKDIDAKEIEIQKLRELEGKARHLEGTAQRVDELESTNLSLEQQVKDLEAEVERQKTAGESDSGLQRNLEASQKSEEQLKDTLESIKMEHDDKIASLRAKLKDRDTTISALVRSSVSMEQKLTSLESQNEQAKDKERTTEAELADLRKTLATAKDSEQKGSSEVVTLQKELSVARVDAERWRRALENDGSTGGAYRYQISMLQKEADENAEKLLERDSAIENLVNQSMTQEAHVQDLKARIAGLLKEVELSRAVKNKVDDAAVKAELRRLQQESSIFAGQIIEQDEELESLKINLQARDEQVLALKKEISELKVRESRDDSSQKIEAQKIEAQKIEASERKLRDEVESLKKDVTQLQADLQTKSERLAAQEIQLSQSTEKSEDAKELVEVQAELDEMREANESYRSELRDIRRELWAAKEASGKASDLQNELAQAKYALDEYKRKADEAQEDTKKDVEKESDVADRTGLREELDDALSANKALETKMAQQLEDLTKSKNDAIESLEAKLRERDEAIEELKKEGSSLDEEQNEEQIEIFQREIESLRTDLMNKSESVEKLQQELSSKSESLEKMQQQLSNKSKSLEKMQDMDGPDDEQDELARDSKSNDDLRRELSRKSEELEVSETAIRDLKQMVESLEASKKDLEKELNETMYDISTNDKQEELTQANQDLVKINDGLLKANKALAEANESYAKEVATLKTDMETFTKDREDSEALKDQLNKEKETRESTEKSIVDSYERQLSLLNLNKDVTIDNLRKDLADSRGKSSEDMGEIIREMKLLESENIGLREQLEVELQAKNQQIYALEHTLHAQEQLVENMRMEMDQLQSGMEHATERRRGEVEEMQQEVIEMESRANKQERETIALKMQLEETKLEHKAEVVRLKDTIMALEKESPLAKTVAELQNDDRMLEVRERLEQLKWRNTSLQEENLKLGGRLERAVIEIKSLEAEKIHAHEMEREVSRLTRQVKTLEEILSRPPNASQASSKGNGASPSRSSVDKENRKDKKPKRNLMNPRKSPAATGSFKFFKRRTKEGSEDVSQQPDARSAVSSTRDDR